MSRPNCKKIKQYCFELNGLWKVFLQDNYWLHAHVENAYYEVFQLMCKLLDVDIIRREYKELGNVLCSLHYYINIFWKIVRKSNIFLDKELFELRYKMSQLLIVIFHVINLYNL